MKLRHVGIVVEDLVEAVEWYEKFGYYPYDFESVELRGKMVQLAKLAHKEGSIIEVLEGTTALPHVSFTVNALEFEAIKKTNDANVFEKEGVCYIRDPWSNIIEIVEERG